MTKSQVDRPADPISSDWCGVLPAPLRTLYCVFHLWLCVLYVERFEQYSNYRATPKYFFGTVVPPGADPPLFAPHARKCLRCRRFGNLSEILRNVDHVLFEMRSVFSPGAMNFCFLAA
ncbi:hypothetical protein PWP93_28745 [Paraburkholderia sp. A1RI-2L]|uniref:hypothetical protein n=1 Tax=Paraburkholderia sp. A1RI-2L TaxID=3028367 RepID=UPI003B7D2610